MIGSILGSVLTRLALGLLKALWARKDLKDVVRLEIANKSLELANKAHRWKARAARDPSAADLRVRPGGQSGIQSFDPRIKK